MSEHENAACVLQRQPDYREVEIVSLDPDPQPADYQEAMRLAQATMAARLGAGMLLSWYDRDRDFESPQHTSHCGRPGAIPGYVNFGLSHGAKLKVDIGQGRFIFFFLPLGE